MRGEQGISFVSMYWQQMLVLGVFMLISWLIGQRLKSKFKKYSKTPIASGLSGKEVAEKMLHDHGIFDVTITCTPGKLTDHYNPKNKSVNLSDQVYNGRNAASTAVAAHEVGHAVQHATKYSMLEFRSAMVPIQNVSGMVMNVIVMLMFFGGSLLYKALPFTEIILVIIFAQAIITAFSIITLPVEFDASKRALAWIKDKNVVTSAEHEMSKDALKWAAMTYVVAALSAISVLLFWILQLLGSRD